MSDLQALQKLCHDMREVHAACIGLHSRLVKLDAAMATAEAAAPPEELRYIVDRFKKLLRKYRQYGSEPFHVRCILYDRIVIALRALHIQAYRISGEPLEWGPTWEKTMKASRDAMLERASDDEFLIDEEYTPGMMIEALAVIQFELNRPESDQRRLVDQSRHVLRQLSNTIQNTTGARVQDRTPQWFIPSYDVELRHLIGSGSFGTMHRALWNDASVFVKKLHTDAAKRTDQLARKNFEREIVACYDIQHDHLVPVLGACHVSSPPFIVYEQAQQGNMVDFIANSTGLEVWRLLYEVALGLQHLHGRGVLHGRLSIDNILVDAQGQARISGFGLLKTRRSFPSRPASTARYRAPECRKGGGNETPASDVFSLAMCIMHAITQELPFGDLDEASILDGACIPDRPVVDTMSNEAWALIEKMAQASPAARCSLEEVVAQLRVFTEQQDTSSRDEGVDPESPTSALLSVEVHDVRQLIEALASQRVTAERLANLKLLYRCLQDEESHKKVGVDGYELVAKIIRSDSSTWEESLYAFSILDRAQRRWNLALLGMESLKIMVKLPDQASLRLVKERISSDDRATCAGACDVVACLALTNGGHCHDVIASLIVLLAIDRQAPPGEYRRTFKAIAADTLGYLALNPSNHQAIRHAGGMKLLVGLLRSASPMETANALWSLACLTQTASSRMNSGLEDGQCLEYYNASRDTICEEVYDAVHEAGATRLLVDILVGDSGDHRHGKVWAALILGSIATTDMSRYKFVSAGAVGALSRLIREGGDEEKTAAAFALSTLSLSKPLARKIIEAMSSVHGPLALHELLSHGTGNVPIWVALTIYQLARNEEVRGSLQSCLAPLVAMMESDDDTTKMYGAAAISQLVLSGGIVPCENVKSAILSLIQLLTVGSDTQKDWAVLAIANLTKNRSIHVFIADSGAISTLTTLIRSGNEKRKMHAVTALARLAYSDFTHATMAQAIIPLAKEVNSDMTSLKTPAIHIISRITPAHLAGPAMDAAIPAMIHLLCRGSHYQSASAASALARLAEDVAVADAIAKAAAIDFLPSLMKLVRGGRVDERKKDALRLLCRLVQNVNFRRSIDANGVISDLLGLATNYTQGDKAQASEIWALAMETLFHLTVDASTHAKFNDSVIRVFEEVSTGGESHAEIWAALTLANLSLRADGQRVIVSTRIREVIERCVVNGDGNEQLWARKTLEQLHSNSEQ